MKTFLNEDFLLESETAIYLYQNFAKDQPILDFHCHLPVKQIAENSNFNTLSEAWLAGDHYKWRAMRANGVNEYFITGKATDFEKFEKWAETVPYTIRNPLYHWTHLELRRYFGIHEILSKSSARSIYDACNEMLQSPEFRVQNMLKKMNVEVVCTTDDPCDDLVHHQAIRSSGSSLKVFPTFRPDQAMNADNAKNLNSYIQKLEQVSQKQAPDFTTYLHLLKERHNNFHLNGCKASDHGINHFFSEKYTIAEVEQIYKQIRTGDLLSEKESLKFKSAMLYNLALWDYEKDWVQQYHVGALRNNNTRLLQTLGPDTGWDSIGDYSQANSMSRFLDNLDQEQKLARTVIYNLNPADNELIASMAGNFNDGSIAGKIQFGSAWWFLDQKDGMIRQINALSNMGLLSRFIGMLTDSRSFLSFPRHEYFRRILCNLIGQDVENGELPNDLPWLGKIIGDICYGNAKDYFRF